MLKQFLKTGLWNQSKKAFLIRDINLYRINGKSIRNASTKNNIDDDDDDLNKPIKYSTSPAATWSAAKSRNPLLGRHPYESMVISISLITFMLYFLVFREENDIDMIFSSNLTETISDVDIKQLQSRSK